MQTGSYRIDQDTSLGGNVIFGEYGVNNVIIGAAGDTLYAGNLNDTLIAAPGDSLVSNSGIDTFVFTVGDGTVVVNEFDNQAKTAGINEDVLQLGAGITPAGTKITRTLSNDLVLSFGNGDQVKVPGYFLSASVQLSVSFFDGTIWNYTAIADRAVLTDTTAGGNLLEGLSSVNNTIIGAPNDAIYTNGLSDTVVGGVNNTIYVTGLNDTITVGNNDTIYAGLGTATVLFSVGDGVVTLNDEFTNGTGHIDQDVLQLGAGITETATQVTRTLSNSLILSFGNGEQMNIDDYFAMASAQPSIAFADGTTWDYAAIAERAVYVDTTGGGNDMVGLSGVNNTIIGAASDTIYAGNLSDKITVGRNDTLVAGAGVDTFIVNAGDGAVTLNEYPIKSIGINQDIVQFGAGISEASIQVTRTLSNSLVLSFGNGDQVTIPDYFTFAYAQASIAFADGTTWNYAAIAQRAVYADTTGGGNYIGGLTGVNNTIIGAASDIIAAGNLNDQITAGPNDTLFAGIDTFIFGAGDGAVTLYGSFLKAAGVDQDVLQLGPGIAGANTHVTQTSSNDLVLSFGNGDQVTIPYYFTYGVFQPTIAFADGTQWNFAALTDVLNGGASPKPSESPPTVTQTLANQTATAGTLFTYTLPSTLFYEAAANDPLTLSATLANGSALPAWLVFNATTGIFSGTPTDQTTGALALNATATGLGDMTASTTLNVQVNPTYEAPTTGQAPATQTISAGSVWSYALPGSLFSEAVAGDTLSYTATGARCRSTILSRRLKKVKTCLFAGLRLVANALIRFRAPGVAQVIDLPLHLTSTV